MKAPGNIQHLDAGDDFPVCPDCGYEYGFHTSFIKADVGNSLQIPSTKPPSRVILICPDCGARYDVGWKIPPGD